MFCISFAILCISAEAADNPEYKTLNRGFRRQLGAPVVTAMVSMLRLLIWPHTVGLMTLPDGAVNEAFICTGVRHDMTCDHSSGRVTTGMTAAVTTAITCIQKTAANGCAQAPSGAPTPDSYQGVSAIPSPVVAIPRP